VPDPFVRTIGTVEDLDGRKLTVGVDYDAVSIDGYRFPFAEQEELGRLLVAAVWEAAGNRIRMEQDA
jgi:hypothetical protein